MHPPRRLLVVTESLGIGGTETHLLRLLPHLVRSGWEITTYCLTSRGLRAPELEATGVSVDSLSDDLTVVASRDLRRLEMGFRAIYSLVRDWRPSIAHFYLPGPYLIGAPAAIIAGTPVKVMSRRSSANYQKNKPLAARLERLLHRRMDAVVGNSRAVIADLLKEGVPAAKLKLIHNGIQAGAVDADRNRVRQTLGLAPGQVVGLMIANLIPYKGHRDLLNGLALVAKNLPPQWHVLLVGRDEGLRDELTALASNSGIRDHLTFLGETTNIAELCAAADFALLTSHEEGFSNALLETMSFGLPVIATHVGGNSDAIVDGESGLLIPPHCPRAIGESIVRITRDSGLRKHLGHAARLRVRENFSIERCVDLHNELYQDLLARTV